MPDQIRSHCANTSCCKNAIKLDSDDLQVVSSNREAYAFPPVLFPAQQSSDHIDAVLGNGEEGRVGCFKLGEVQSQENMGMTEKVSATS